MTLLLPPQPKARAVPRARPTLRQITVDEYHRMIAAGIIRDGEPYELLGGYLVLKDRSDVGGHEMSFGEKHIWGVSRLTRLGQELGSKDYYLQLQAPIVTSNLDEPEPDGAIVRGNEDNYLSRKVTAADVSCVIEVSSSSLNHDRTEKVIAYADSGIKQYIIINLVDDVVEEHTQPKIGKGRYGRIVTLTKTETVEFMLPDGSTWPIPVQKLVP